jgi:hypothetical protein
MPYEVIALDRDTARESIAEIRQIVLSTGEGELVWPRIPVQIDDLEQLGDVLDGWGVKVTPSQLDVQNALDRYQVWVRWGVAVRQIRGARRDR